MSQMTARPTTCHRCLVTMPAGTLVGGGKRLEYHYDGCPTPAQIATTAGTATAKQVDFADSLQGRHWTPAVFGGKRYSRAELALLSRPEISRVIDALRDESRD